jgi:hypothetical protein
MSVRLLIISILVFTGGTSVRASLPADSVRVSISVSRGSLAIGDSVTVESAVTVPRGITATEPFPMEPDPLLDIEKRDVREEPTASGAVRTYRFLAYISAVDTVRIGPFAVRWSSASGDSGSAVSNTLVIPIKGLVEKPDAAPKPSRAPLPIPSRGLPWWLIPLAAALVAAGAVWYLLKRRKKPGAVVPVPLKPIDELDEFERIRLLRLLETGQVKELYASVSGAMRAFMHRNMGFEAMYRTTGEIKRALDRASVDPAVKESIRGIFDESDMVKFAKFIPPAERSSTIIDRALVPVRSVLEQAERERLAEEERKRAQTAGKPPAETPAHAGGGNPPAAGGGDR